ncbi:MAG: hypothetical protein B7Z20_03150 [Sphingobium sp. 32-64-5]|nr:MAG: hypothetical protein B7Z20_03150 [Sphingobium sp. 32-64-5]
MTQHFLKPALASVLSPLLAFALLVGGATAALADVKKGVDAWAQGDYVRAVQEWTPLAQQGDPDALFNLGQAYKLGRGVPTDMGLAIDYYRKAAAQGHSRAEDNYGLVLFQQNRRVEAMPYIERSAQRGEARAQYLLGIALFNGDFAAKDWPRAYAMMSRAASTGLPQATSSLAQMDRFIPEDQRQQGLALAARMAGEEQAAKLTAASAPIAPAPTPLKQTALPPATLTPPAVVTPPATVTPPIAVAPPATIAQDTPNPAIVQPATDKPDTATPPDTPPPKSSPALGAAPAATPVAQVAPAATPVATIAPAGKWRVQLGAFSMKARAQAQWQILAARVRDLSDFTPIIDQSGAFARLLAGPFATQGEARRLCGKVRAAGSDCLVTSR